VFKAKKRQNFQTKEVDTTIEQFSIRFVEFRKFEDTTKCIKYSDAF